MDRNRKEKVREIIVSKPFTSLSELTAAFPQFTEMTLRRDIEYWEQQGECIKVRGGARAMRFISLSKEASFYQRLQEGTDAKSRMAKEAAAFMETGRSMFFDSGSTVLQMAAFLPKQRLTVFTTDPNTALELIKHEQVEVNIIGGHMSPRNLSLSGQQAIDAIEHTNIDVAFISPSGFSPECGFTGGNYDECEFKKCVIAKAKTVVVLLADSKIDKSMPYTFAALSDVQVVICDEEPPEVLREAAAEAGVKLITAK